jgi:lipopolysaccharide export system ATP-binding protein
MLELRDVHVDIASAQVLRGLRLQVGKGEMVGLVGRNGAGKTSTLRSIMGHLPLRQGHIHFNGQSLSALPPEARAGLGIGYMPEDRGLVPELTVEENIRAVLELQIDNEGKKFSKAMIEQQLDSLLEELQITHIRRNSALSLSGGERRRVEISRALATRPRFILLDEPFAGVDPIAVIEIQRIVRFLKSRGIGVLITDHNVRETLGICDRAYIISEGKVLTTGKPEDIINDASVRKVYLGEHFKM